MPTCTPLSTTTTNYGLCKPADGETNWGTAYRTSMDTIDTQIFNASVPRSYLAGLGLVNNGARKIDISAGLCMGNDQATRMSIAATLTKDLNAAWAVGSGNGGLFTGAIAGTTWYHVFLIKRTDTLVVDAGFDTSVTAANIPSPYTIFRRLGSVRTDGGSNILAFVQDGDYFRWLASIGDVNVTNPTNAAVTRTVTTPPGVTTIWFGHVGIQDTTPALTLMLLSDLAANDEAINSPNPLGQVTNLATANIGVGYCQVRTNTSSQIRSRASASTANTNFFLATLGYLDTRGRNT